MRRIKTYVVTESFLVVAAIFLNVSTNVFASEKNVSVAGNIYTLSEKNSEFSTENQIPETATNENSYGQFSLSGNLTESGEENGVISFNATGETIIGKTGEDESEIEFLYTYDENVVNTDEDETWELVEDDSRKINGIDIGEKAGLGTIVVQSSFDNETWMVNEIQTNAFERDKVNTTEGFYETVRNQLINGCYYRVTVAYQTRKRTGQTQIGTVKVKDNYEYCEHVEIYEFYIINETENAKAASSTDEPRYEFNSDPVNAGVDTEYSGNDEIDSDDINRGCQIGKFYINGFSGNPYEDNKGNPVFLKNVGDKITLWFDLNQEDITALNGNQNLSVYSDGKGGDKALHVSKQNFKRGALVIQFTDYQNKKTTNTYIDYLAAAATTTADTKVQLFEEGDYEIALDYEIEDSSPLVWKVPKPAKRYAYRISFKFSIRNSNCMVYPMNLNGGELQTFYSEDGFKLDMAKSRYLELTIKRRVLSGNRLVVRDSQVASDLEEFTEEGIYEITVKNRVTKDKNTQEIYVGTDNLLKAYLRYDKTYSISELQKMKENGCVFLDDGTIESPEPEVQDELNTAAETADSAEEEVQNAANSIGGNVQEEYKTEPEKIDGQSASSADLESSGAETGKTEATDDAGQKSGAVFAVLILVATILACILFWLKRKKQ